MATPQNICILARYFNARWYPGPGRGGKNPPIQPWATINDWRNSTGELLLHSHHITYATRYRNDEGISIIDHIQNSGPQCVLQPNALLVATDVEIVEQSDHRPIWSPYTVLGGRGTQGRNRKEKQTRD